MVLSRVFTAVVWLLVGLCADVVYASHTRLITFVCEHGVAKSVIAAAIFNREAAAVGLNVVAQARGVTPESMLQPATVQGLKADGLDTSGFVPTRISEHDVAESELVVTLGVAEEPPYLKGGKLREWDNVPPVSSGYDEARDAISVEVKVLVAELANAQN